MKTFIGVCYIIFVMPLWLYLVYKILQGVHATPLMWGIFIAYAPLTMIFGIMSALVKEET